MKVSSGEQALPHHSAMLSNHSSSGQSSHNSTEGSKSASDKRLQGAIPDSAVPGDDPIVLQDSITDAVQTILNKTANSSGPAASLGKHEPGSASQALHPVQAGDKQGMAEHADELLEADAALPLQSAADSLGSVSQSAPRQSVPEEVTSRPQANAHGHPAAVEHPGPIIVTQQQMDESGYADAFAQIMDSIPAHIKNAASPQSQDQESSNHEVHDAGHEPDSSLRKATYPAEDNEYAEYLES